MSKYFVPRSSLSLFPPGIRYIYGIRRDKHISSYRREVYWLWAVGRRNYFIACTLRKIFNTKTRNYNYELFRLRESQRLVRGDVMPLDIL